MEIFERPGRWMTESRLESLCQDLKSVAAMSLSAGALEYGVFSGAREHLENTVITIVRGKRGGKPIAFNALALMDVSLTHSRVRVIHLGLVLVDESERRKGLSWILYGLTCVLLFVRGGLQPIHVSNVTQVPAVVGMVSQTFSEVCPTPEDPEPRDFRKVLTAREIMRRHRHVFGVGEDAEFDEKSFIIRNAYTGGSDNLKKAFEDTPRHRDSRFNDWCEQSLDYDRGDDFLQIGEIDLQALQRYATRAIPGGAVPQVLAVGLLVFARRALLPAINWFNAGADFGPLRAR